MKAVGSLGLRVYPRAFCLADGVFCVFGTLLFIWRERRGRLDGVADVGAGGGGCSCGTAAAAAMVDISYSLFFFFFFRPQGRYLSACLILSRKRGNRKRLKQKKKTKPGEISKRRARFMARRAGSAACLL